jgi:hypothetical protein
MSIEFEVSGSSQLHVLAARIRAVGDKGLGREFGDALKKTAEPVQAAVREESARVLPGSYAALFSTSLRFRTQLRTGAREASLRLVTFADGKKERRDIVSINQGALRHPLFGNRRHWYATRVRSGFFDRGTDQAADEAEKKMLAVLDDFAKRLM